MDTNFYFSAKGRVSRKDFWLKWVVPVIILYVVIAVIFFGLMSAIGEAAGILGLVLIPVYIAIVWAGVCVSAKRFHDRNMSGWWVLYFFLIGVGLYAVQMAVMAAFGAEGFGAILVMLLGLASLVVSIVQLVILGFLPGTPGLNQYGPDPRDPAGGTADTFS